MGRRKTRSERLMRTTDVIRLAEQGHRAMRVLDLLIIGQHPEKNPLKQLVLFKQHTRALIELHFAMNDCMKAQREMMLLETPNNHLAWTQDEDESLVESRARGVVIHTIAMTLGRTPAAVATRLSTLIGVPRSQIVTAYIEGTVDEEPVRGLFHGKARHVS
jgi:hypothetical protein